MKKILLVLMCCTFLSACVNRPTEPDNFYYTPVKTDFFTLMSFEKNIKIGEPLRIYLEGNGNPNPKKTIALTLAEKDPYQNVIYLARPCQFSDDEICSSHPLIWKEAQFNTEIVNEMKNAVMQLIRKYKAPSIEFVGYDGGATMALLLATRIPQTTRVITIGGILDTDAYQQNTGTSFNKSLNPADEKNQLSLKHQIHYVGKLDKKTPLKTAERFVSSQRNAVNAVVKSVNNVGHCDWEDVQFDYYNLPNSSKR